ncbi:serine-rich adhesin for platelets-like [Mytilus californianus]|uniref:serine-rich adhesin for platelets-like n=1 Tax=Mytilus californianus TaxID=6549 RepID=UPI002245AF95|nr:serine-rich adhesin for platelets-like [Mytilus californianus]
MADAMERGCSYHAMFIYNKPKLKNNRKKNRDFEVSFEVVKFAVDKMATWGFEKTYYHDRDALPGSNIFGEFFDTVKASRFTVVVLTKGFLSDCWGKYKSQAAFTKLIDQDKSKRFIAMYIDLEHIPDEFNTMNSLCFSADWQNEHREWEKFKMLLNTVTHPVQDTGPDRFPMTHNTSGYQNAILYSRGTLQHPQAGLAGNNLLVGVQETNPPNLPRGNSILETDAGPHDLPETTDNLQPVIPNTTNRSDNGNTSNQQSGGGNQDSHGFSVTQSNDSSIIYQRHSTNGLNSNNSAPGAIATNPTSSSTTTASLHVENNQSTTQTGVGPTPSVVTPPNTVMATTGNNMEENIVLTQGAQAVASTSTTMQTSGTRAQEIASRSTTMQTSASREPPDGAATLTNSPPVYIQHSSDTNLKNIVGRDNGDEDYPSSSLNRNDVEPDNSGQSISNSTDNQSSTDSLKTETKDSQPEHTKRFVCPKDGHSNSQHDSGYDQGLNFDSIASDHQDTNGFNTESIGINRLNDYSALLTNNSDRYESMDGPATNRQGASLLLSTMRRMLPGTRSTMRNTMGTMIKPIAKFVQKCDQSYF